MRTLKIEVNDSLFNKVIAFFNQLPKNDVKIVVDEDTTIKFKKLHSLSLKTKGYVFKRDEANER